MADDRTIESQLMRFAKTLEGAEQQALNKSLSVAPDVVPDGIRDQFDTFVQKERDAFYEEQKANARALDPSFAIPMLANQVRKLEEKLRIMEFDNLTKEESPIEQIEENTQNIDDIKHILQNVRGTGYNISPRIEADGSIEIFGRYNGPFCAEPLTKDQQSPSAEPKPYSDTLRVYRGGVYAGNSTFYWPTDLGDPGNAIEYRDFKFDHTTLESSPTGVSGVWTVYMEVAAYPSAADCSQLWDGVEARRYSPVLRAYKNPISYSTLPDQKYSQSDHTQAEDLAYCATTGGNIYTRTNPRGLDSGEDIICAKFVLGQLTLGTNEEETRVEIVKWKPSWHASDIYCPVWQWNHCTDADGIGDYPDADTLECIYGASLCSPTCFTPWDYFTDHYHKTNGTDSSFPYEDDCALDGTGPADNQQGG